MTVSTLEEILLHGNQFEVRGGDGEPFQGVTQDLLNVVLKHSVIGFDEVPLPKNNLLWKVVAGPLTVCIVELEPAFRMLRWIQPESLIPFGPEAEYANRRLATPYVILKVPFLNGTIIPRAELFYRNRPLTHADEELYWPNLLNVSPNSYDCRSWICTQYLRRERPQPGVTPGLNALLHHLWGGGFNRSSEQHEGSSAFKKANEDNLDSRVTDVIRWEQESINNPRFVLDVQWKPAEVTVRQLIQEELNFHNVTRDLSQAGELVNLLSATRKPKPEKTPVPKPKPK